MASTRESDPVAWVFDNRPTASLKSNELLPAIVLGWAEWRQGRTAGLTAADVANLVGWSRQNAKEMLERPRNRAWIEWYDTEGEARRYRLRETVSYDS